MTATPDSGPPTDAPVLVNHTSAYVKVLTLNRPGQANALSVGMVAALVHEVSGAYADDTRLLVLRGEGKHFCAGLYRDPKAEPEPADRIATAVSIETLLQLLWNAPFVTMAQIGGGAFGAGAEIAVACDYRVADGTARFAFPGFRLMGVSMGTRRFAQLVGRETAFDIVLNNRRLDRATALEIGLVTHALDADQAAALQAEVAASAAEVEKPAIAHLRDALRSADGGADLSRVAASLGAAHRGRGGQAG